MQKAIEKARILIEAMPYIKSFGGRTFVIKYGGSAMKNKRLKEIFISDIALLNYIGVHTIIVHGGGDDISKLAAKLGKKAVFVDGHRVTDRGMLEIVEKVLVGKINKRIVDDIKKHGLKVIGISGKDVNLIIAKKKLLKGKDIGFVGQVVKINTEILKVFERSDTIPVIAPVGKDKKGEMYNINADAVAGEIAAALQADKLIYITDTDGVKVRGSYLTTLKVKQIAGLVKSGQITGGMMPKVASAKSAIASGVKKVHIINGTTEHSLLLEIFTREGIGTEIVR